MKEREPVIPEGLPKPPEELTIAEARRYKVNLCRSFVVGNYRSCKYGSQCHFAHGQHEQRPEGYGPTPEEAYKSGAAMSPELEAWWHSVRVGPFAPPSRHHRSSTQQSRAASNAGGGVPVDGMLHLSAEEDEELSLLRDQFPEEFQRQLEQEQKEQWHEPARPKRISGGGSKQQQQQHSYPSPRQSANGTSPQQQQQPAVPTQGRQTPPLRPERVRLFTKALRVQPSQTGLASPTLESPPSAAAAGRSAPAERTPPMTATAPQGPFLVVDKEAKELALLNRDLAQFRDSSDMEFEASLPMWPVWESRCLPYKNLAVEIAGFIISLDVDIEAESAADSQHLDMLRRQRLAATQEYEQLAPVVKEMNKLLKQIKKRLEAFTTTHQAAQSPPSQEAAAHTPPYTTVPVAYPSPVPQIPSPPSATTGGRPTHSQGAVQVRAH